MGRIGTQELLLILGISLLIFGPAHLPKLGTIFGKTIRSFKDSVDKNDVESSADSQEN